MCYTYGMKNYTKSHVLRVPMVLWDEITLQATLLPGKKSNELALDHIRSGIYAQSPQTPFKSAPTGGKTIKKSKTKKKDYILYQYNEEQGFYYETRPEYIEELKKFFYNMGTIEREIFDSCLCDPTALPEGDTLAGVSDCASQLWEKKVEAGKNGGKFDSYQR